MSTPYRDRMMDIRRSGVIVLIVLATLLGACERSEVDGIGSNTPSEEAPPQRDLVGQVDCSVGERGWVTGAGQVRNGATGTSSYEVVIGFYAGGVRIGDRSAWIRDIDPAETATFDANVWLGDAADTMTSCEVVTVNRWTAANAG